MRIEHTRYTERFGAVRINEIQKIIELDSGRDRDLSNAESIAVRKISEETIKDFEEKLLIVIPTMNEKLKLLEGVISGIPHESIILVISNSERKKVDRFRMERDTLEQYCHFARREAYIVHQKDETLARALVDSGYKDIIGDDGLIRNGKAEGMLAAIFMAMALNKQFIGFIDADNYFPGAVWEYVKCYAAGFSMARSPYCMVRIVWRYKPKLSEGLYFRKWGRVSEITNRCINSLLSARSGFETDIVKTGNAGEHAMSVKLAEILTYASRFAVEPQELISIFEGFGGVLPMIHRNAAKDGVGIFQLETRNPHLHEDKGEEHLKDMLLPGLGTIYHSPLCDDGTKAKIIQELQQQNALGPDEEPPLPQLFAPPKTIDNKKFKDILGENLQSYAVLEKK